ncbi:AraC family transcriptional regulator [Paenibacillus glycanilyticus]|uniref:AraC family transcriptional regulator n=1 Tax=Paenibacillus glycanilyticus TaxID=126569 RepID=UPI00204000AA|nr:AraC family transcriptional regulator [Paenibacillus glycanilyticus]MCM3629055.1 AraC family transcriptional regulator [Paenibacillus glycanilyticus]
MDKLVFPILADSDLKLPLYVDIIGHWNNQETIDRRQGFPYYQWLQATAGEGELWIGEEKYTVKAGQGFCLFPGVPHGYYAVREPWDVYFISFGGSQAKDLLAQAGIKEPGLYSVTDSEMIVSHLRSISAMAESGLPFLGIECSKLAYQFLLDLMKVVQVSTQSAEQYYTRLHPVIRYIEEHIDSVMSIQDLSSRIGVTPQYLCRLFKQLMGMRPMEYVNRERINRSKELMFLGREHKMHEIAAMVGFDSASYFSTVFKKQEGISPEQFKKLHGIH